MYNSVNSRYTYPGTDIVINKLNIKSEKELKKLETKLVSFKLASIRFEKIDIPYGVERLRWIHKYLFGDIYEFAGEYRLENITKDQFRFSEFKYIEDNIENILKNVDIEEIKKKDFDDLVIYLSFLLTELNVLHPFREGNGRTIREFVREICYDCGYFIDWQVIDYDLIIAVSKKAIADETEQIELLKKSLKKL